VGDNWLMTVGYKTFGWRQVVNDMRLGYNRIMNVRSQMTEKPPSERSLASTVYGVYTFDSIGLPAMLTETLLPLTIACVQLSAFNFYLIYLLANISTNISYFPTVGKPAKKDRKMSQLCD